MEIQSTHGKSCPLRFTVFEELCNRVKSLEQFSFSQKLTPVNISSLLASNSRKQLIFISFL